MKSNGIKSMGSSYNSYCDPNVRGLIKIQETLQAMECVLWLLSVQQHGNTAAFVFVLTGSFYSCQSSQLSSLFLILITAVLLWGTSFQNNLYSCNLICCCKNKIGTDAVIYLPVHYVLVNCY